MLYVLEHVRPSILQAVGRHAEALVECLAAVQCPDAAVEMEAAEMKAGQDEASAAVGTGASDSATLATGKVGTDDGPVYPFHDSEMQQQETAQCEPEQGSD